MIRRAINSLVDAAKKPDLYYANKEVYSLLRYGASVKENVASHNQTVKFINWEEPHKNNFYIAEEVTVQGEHTKGLILFYISMVLLFVFLNLNAASYRSLRVSDRTWITRQMISLGHFFQLFNWLWQVTIRKDFELAL